MLNPHEPSATHMHEHVPEVPARVLQCKLIGAHQVTKHQPDLQPLIDRVDALKVPKTCRKTTQSGSDGDFKNPWRKFFFGAADRDREAQHHGREAACLNQPRDPVALADEDDHPWRQAHHVHYPRGDPQPLLLLLVFLVLGSFSGPEEDLLHEIADACDPFEDQHLFHRFLSRDCESLRITVISNCDL